MSEILQPTGEQAAPDLPQMMDPEEKELDQDWGASLPSMSFVSEAILSDIKPAIQRSKKWRILVYGINQADQDEANDHHLSLLSGIIGEQISQDKKQLPNFSFEKNGVTTMIHVGSHAHCGVSYEDVDLLLYFTRANKESLVYNFTQMETEFKEISQSRGTLIWKHSVIVLTGVDMIMDDCKKRKGDPSTQLQTLLGTWRLQIKHSLSKAIKDETEVSSENVVVQPAGRQEEPDLPTPLDKWFSKLWYECFHASKVKSMPAILKLAMRRITNSINSKEIQQCQFYEQPIQAKLELLEEMIMKTSFSTLGSKTVCATGGIAGAAIAGGIAFGVASLSVTVMTGIILAGSVVGVGAIAATQWYRARQAAVSKPPEKIKTSELKQFYTELLALIPNMRNYLTKWAKGQTTCKILVAGVKGEGVSTVAAALTGQKPTNESRQYKHCIALTDASLIVHEFPGFPMEGRREDKAKELVHFQKKYGTHLLIFCIPITSSRENFVYSEHIKYLERLCEIDSTILSNTIIALTHANELREVRRQDPEPQRSFNQFFVDELKKWMKHIKTELRRFIHTKSEETDVPVVPVGNFEVSIDFSEDENPAADTQYHWLSQLLLSAMPATKPEGLPALIKANRKRLEDFPDEYPEADKAWERIINAQCSLFSKTGLKDRSHQGEAIGLMLGVNDEQNW